MWAASVNIAADLAIQLTGARPSRGIKVGSLGEDIFLGVGEDVQSAIVRIIGRMDVQKREQQRIREVAGKQTP